LISAATRSFSLSSIYRARAAQPRRALMLLDAPPVTMPATRRSDVFARDILPRLPRCFADAVISYFADTFLHFILIASSDTSINIFIASFSADIAAFSQGYISASSQATYRYFDDIISAFSLIKAEDTRLLPHKADISHSFASIVT